MDTKKEDDVVVVSGSDSEEDEEKQSNKQYQFLASKIKPILFYQYQPEHKVTDTFPYAKFDEFAKDLKKSLALVNVKSNRALFIWKHLIRWLLSMKLCFESVSDIIDDKNYNLILTDLMAQYVNYKCQLYCSVTDENKINSICNEIVITLSLIFSGWVPGILMTLLKIQVNDNYRLILYPIFRKFLSKKEIPETDDLISYLRLILCFRKWKQLARLKEGKEIINEIAVGKSTLSLKSDQIDLSSSDDVDPVLPKTVPIVTEDNRTFANITRLIGFASKKPFGTRILLMNKTLELDDTIEEFFKRYHEYINRDTPKLLRWSRVPSNNHSTNIFIIILIFLTHFSSKLNNFICDSLD